MKERGRDDLNFSVLTLKQLVLFQCTLSTHSLPLCVYVGVLVPVCIYVYFWMFALHIFYCVTISAVSFTYALFPLYLLSNLGLLRCCQAGLQWGWQHILCEFFIHTHTQMWFLSSSVCLTCLSFCDLSHTLHPQANLTIIKPLCHIWWCDFMWNLQTSQDNLAPWANITTHQLKLLCLLFTIIATSLIKPHESDWQ